jgi:hypothetical protein
MPPHVRQHGPRHEERRTVVQIQHLVENQDVDTSELGRDVVGHLARRRAARRPRR